ncbi:hypothetical protein [Pseudorhodoplanes sinuspersici]|uniref:hypothetical protein n=1 Tax=Pseudorhodoplanes sinuspersici TaxID=1235591 RepID=UPI000FF42DB2|nr:hypothetical protein [Pseudorhodoplanes sinuspersici]RKE67514.1 hypothetical protein DFP91_5279 [Pseudorhodoplanes sinuspersici]
MAIPAKTDEERSLARLLSEIARQQQTIDKLKAAGHACPDAERQLHQLKEALALLR